MPPLVTFFSIPKPFNERFATIQRNAIRSWVEMGPDTSVILMGDDPGTADTARDLNVTHLPDIGRNEYGTPLLNSLFESAETHGDGTYLCYINADIVLTSDFLPAVRDAAKRKPRFLMVGQRTDFDQRGPIDFNTDWETRLRDEAAAFGKLHRPTGIDYFLFRRGIWGTPGTSGGLPPFAIGRFVWDNWLIYRARQQQVTVIDATKRVLAIHQNHDYSHVTGGLHRIANGPEARFNLALAGGNKHLFTIWDATHVLTKDDLVRRTEQPGALGGGIWSYRRSVTNLAS